MEMYRDIEIFNMPPYISYGFNYGNYHNDIHSPTNNVDNFLMYILDGYIQ